jgi:hypothetical protein
MRKFTVDSSSKIMHLLFNPTLGVLAVALFAYWSVRDISANTAPWVNVLTVSLVCPAFMNVVIQVRIRKGWNPEWGSRRQ